MSARASLPPLGLAAALLTLAAAGCVLHVGSRAEDVDAAQSPEGTAVRVETRSGRVMEGELLDAADSALLVRSAGRIVLARYEQVSAAVFGSPTTSKACCRPPLPEELYALRLVSRYPQGVSPALLVRLLAVAKQPEVEVAR